MLIRIKIALDEDVAENLVRWNLEVTTYGVEK